MSRNLPQVSVCSRRGLTLVELVVSVAVLGVIGAATLPVIHAAADGYASAVRARRVCERASMAIDQCVRLIRDLPADAQTGVLEIAEASSTRLVFVDGRGLDFSGGDLSLVEGPGESSTIANALDAFAITCLASDGVTDAADDLEQTQRVRITLTLEGFTLSAIALPRAISVPRGEGG